MGNPKDPRNDSVRLAARDALTRVPAPDGCAFAELYRHGSMSIEVYAPRGHDPQQPHTRDELYVVISGRGMFRCGERSFAFEPGDLLFVPAGIPHRFEGFGDDFATWVVFYGPEGGERSGTAPSGQAA